VPQRIASSTCRKGLLWWQGAFSRRGLGLTRGVLHDARGPIGIQGQALTA